MQVSKSIAEGYVTCRLCTSCLEGWLVYGNSPATVVYSHKYTVSLPSQTPLPPSGYHQLTPTQTEQYAVIFILLSNSRVGGILFVTCTL
jgi:hypothetical protein